MRSLSISLFIGCLLACSVRAGVVEDWNEAFIKAVHAQTPPPALTARNLAVFHLAIQRAVSAAIAKELPEAEQQRAAVLTADEVFRSFFPSQTKLADDLLAKHGHPVAMALAAEVAKAVLAEREGDGATTTVHYVPSNVPGKWRRTPAALRPPELPQWGLVRPFVLKAKEVTDFRAPPPPELKSEAYAKEVNEVRSLGGAQSTLRTAEQALIARFWSDFSYTTSPPGHWNDIARDITRQRGLPLAESAKLFAALNMAMADASIVMWETKYHYNFWRPVTAIQRADEDNNPATEPDKTWVSMLPTPPHPEYVSGHSGFSGAAAAVLGHFFGSDKVHFEVRSDTVKDVTRSFDSFAACAFEVGLSRVYAGIHFPMSCREGLKLGEKVAGAVLEALGE